jgi:hypothetical protein
LIAAGDDGFHRCGITADTTTYCWGPNASGQLGDGTTVDAPDSLPVAVVGGHKFASLALGRAHTCGITVAGAALCWGSNDRGELGVGTRDTLRSLVPTPIAVTGQTFRADGVTTRRYKVCATTTTGSVYCWGDWGLATPQPYLNGPTPLLLPGGLLFARIAASSVIFCGITEQGVLHCAWNPPVGDGTNQASDVPRRVALQP